MTKLIGVIRARVEHDLTGVQVGDNHIVLLSITVTRPGSNPYAVTFPGAVPESQMGRCVPGNSVAVKIDPANPKALMIDWDAF